MTGCENEKEGKRERKRKGIHLQEARKVDNPNKQKKEVKGKKKVTAKRR